MRTTYVFDHTAQKLVVKSVSEGGARSHGIVRDFSEPVYSHADGQWHSTKRSFMDGARARGLELCGSPEEARAAAKPRDPFRDAPPVAESLRLALRQNGL